MGRFRCLVDPSLGKGFDWDMTGTFEMRKSGPETAARSAVLLPGLTIFHIHFDLPKCRAKGLINPPKSMPELLQTIPKLFQAARLMDFW